MNLEIGSKIKFKNMPITYPTATVKWIYENGMLDYKLNEPLTRMGYDKTEMNDRFHVSFNESHSKANTVVDGSCSINDVERI
jgi:hypothetical protein